MSEEYVCTLDAASLEVARDELSEDPKERLGAVSTLRDWVKQQTHIKAPTDTDFLLKFLRTAKFSQLRAREVLQGYLSNKVKHPEWINDLDTTDPVFHKVLRMGMVTPIPERDDKGRKIIIVNEGALGPEDMKRFSVKDVMRAIVTLIIHLHFDENVLVNGYVLFEDFTIFTPKHLTFWGMENMKNMSKMWEGKMPGRQKAFHFFNTGPVFETLFAVCKPLFSKKMQNRFHVHGKNMEDIYKLIPMRYFPTEYLPDDYKGPNQGNTKDIIEKLIDDLKSPKVRERMLHETNSKWTIDLSQKADDVPNESFRRLNVD